jgi:tripartite-type tricarboxylate transporter receptor subunit TctC
VVPFGFDGAADRVARAFARCADPAIEVENVPGEGGLAGVRRANALVAANESVLLLATPSTHVLLPARLGGEAAPAAALAPLAGLGFAPNVLLVSSRVAARDVASLVALARREPLTYASAGAGQTIHLCTALFCRQAGIAMAHRPYAAGSTAAYDDLRAGRVHVYFDNVLACREPIAAGDVVPLAVSARARSPLLPEVPTLLECGFPHALDVWFGVFGARLEGPLAMRIAASAQGDTLSPALATIGLRGGPFDGSELARVVASSRAAWAEALAAA